MLRAAVAVLLLTAVTAMAPPPGDTATRGSKSRQPAASSEPAAGETIATGRSSGIGAHCRARCVADANPLRCIAVCRSDCSLLPNQLWRIAGACLVDGPDVSGTRPITEARDLLVKHGFATRGDFDGLTIRTCRFRACTNERCTVAGIVPRPDLMIVSDRYTQWSPQRLAALMAHELVHVKQRRRLGSTGYDCLYGSYLRRGLGYGMENPIEKTAYDLDSRVLGRLRKASE